MRNKKILAFRAAEAVALIPLRTLTVIIGSLILAESHSRYEPLAQTSNLLAVRIGAVTGVYSAITEAISIVYNRFIVKQNGIALVEIALFAIQALVVNSLAAVSCGRNDLVKETILSDLTGIAVLSLFFCCCACHKKEELTQDKGTNIESVSIATHPAATFGRALPGLENDASGSQSEPIAVTYQQS